MFINNQPENQLNNYIDLLQRVGSLSRLFSDSSTPYLYYRAAENIFCRSFEANNHSRSDTSADASKGQAGLGLKTFIDKNGSSWQKIAEFNKRRMEYSDLNDKPELLVTNISRLRNKRLDFAKSLHGLDNLIYHCVTRSKGRFHIFEEAMKYVDIENITLKSINSNTIHFTDGHEDYNFNLSKSTLFKKFVTQNSLDFDVSVIEDPFDFLTKLNMLEIFPSKDKYIGSVLLPLYSFTPDKGKYVPEKSGLNQWNAGGRKRDDKEVYIRIPAWIHTNFIGFFPPRSETFNLKLPDGKILSAGVFQDGAKALMSNPNRALGNWLIDKVLKIESGKVVTYLDLEDVGIDSVEIQKIDDNNFSINFRQIGSYENFELKNRG